MSCGRSGEGSATLATRAQHFGGSKRATTQRDDGWQDRGGRVCESTPEGGQQTATDRVYLSCRNEEGYDVPRSAVNIQEGPDELREKTLAASQGEKSNPVAIASARTVRRSSHSAPMSLLTSIATDIPDPAWRGCWVWIALGAVLAALLTAGLVGWLG